MIWFKIFVTAALATGVFFTVFSARVNSDPRKQLLDEFDTADELLSFGVIISGLVAVGSLLYGVWTS